MHKIFPQPRKAQWVEEGEKCTKYFLNLEKLNELKKEKNAQNISSTSKKRNERTPQSANLKNKQGAMLSPLQKSYPRDGILLSRIIYC